MMACSHDDLDMVKVFIKQKCRLTTTPEQKEDKGHTGTCLHQYFTLDVCLSFHLFTLHHFIMHLLEFHIIHIHSYCSFNYFFLFTFFSLVFAQNMFRGSSRLGLV